MRKAAPVETAPVEVETVEVAPVEAAPVEVAPLAAELDRERCQRIQGSRGFL